MTTFMDAENDSIRPTHVEVDLSALRENLAAIRVRAGAAKVMAVVKANAYGHGLVEVARHMEKCGADCLGVALLEEGLALRKAGVTLPVLVFGGIPAAQMPSMLRHGLEMTAPSVEKLRQMDEAAAAAGIRARVHLKVDTGMGRIGVQYFNARTLIEAGLACRHVEVAGIYSHFANADAADLSHARLQLERFHEALAVYEKLGVPTPARHIANSAAILQLPESHLDMVRPGILLYGVQPGPECPLTLPVRPALTWRSRVVYFKVLPSGHPVSYGSTWQSDHPVRVVTVPCGYGDGFPRALSNKAHVLIRGARFPVVGKVCMDQFMVNLGQGTAYNGDEVVLVGAQGGEVIRVEEVAERADTIAYEILTGISSRVPRAHVGD
ncbi:MAG TPA: alanine racemase [Verrucomicrobiales bacterium]|nr:alanine racemase [Verrucomicrobiales bacterium]